MSLRPTLEEQLCDIQSDLRLAKALAISKMEQVERLTAILNTPEIEDFDKALPIEAAHQVQRWGSAHDAGKEPQDWFWLIGYLAGKALVAHIAGNKDKAKHHCISAAAALRNWHAHIRTGSTQMRPGANHDQKT